MEGYSKLCKQTVMPDSLLKEVLKASWDLEPMLTGMLGPTHKIWKDATAQELQGVSPA